MMTRWKLIVEYDGRPYCGFQRQDDVPSIQGALEEAITKFCQQDIVVIGAGRTDAGVHAFGQVVHFDLDYGARALSGFDLAKALNAHLMPQPIAVIDAVPVPDSFHARFGAKMKTYRYDILNRPFMAALDQGRVWWVKRSLDVDAMKKAAQYLIGTHDFTTFRDSACQAKNPIRSVDSITIEKTKILNGQRLSIIVTGPSFLHHMVRNIAGTLVLVGEGKWQPEEVKTALEARDRTKGGPTAFADGLYLVQIDYNGQ